MTPAFSENGKIELPRQRAPQFRRSETVGRVTENMHEKIAAL